MIRKPALLFASPNQVEQIVRIRDPIDSKVVLTINCPGNQKTFDVEIVRVDISTLSTE